LAQATVSETALMPRSGTSTLLSCGCHSPSAALASSGCWPPDMAEKMTMLKRAAAMRIPCSQKGLIIMPLANCNLLPAQILYSVEGIQVSTMPAPVMAQSELRDEEVVGRVLAGET